jgi:micrococcal nuclease
VNPYQYRGRVVKVVDGDTVDVDIDLGFGITRRERVRLAGVNTPELHSKDAASQVAAKAAREFVVAWCSPLSEVFLRTEKEREKYGRYLAEVVSPSGESLNASLVKAGLAVEYHGEARQSETTQSHPQAT